VASEAYVQLLYSAKFQSKFRRQIALTFKRIAAVMVFGNAGDMPLLPGRFNVHIDSAAFDTAVVEADAYSARAAFLVSWPRTRSRLRSLRVPPTSQARNVHDRGHPL